MVDGTALVVTPWAALLGLRLVTIAGGIVFLVLFLIVDSVILFDWPTLVVPPDLRSQRGVLRR